MRFVIIISSGTKCVSLSFLQYISMHYIQPVSFVLNHTWKLVLNKKMDFPNIFAQKKHRQYYECCQNHCIKLYNNFILYQLGHYFFIVGLVISTL